MTRPSFPRTPGPATVARCRSSLQAEKNEISHRGRAARMLAAHLAAAREVDAERPMIRTKSGAAALSIASNATLIAIKLAAGAITGSIAIVTEAVHSLIDLVASVIAFVSVRKADEPADAEHPYGHEKVENLAATIEGMLILVGAGIIVFEATHRLVVGSTVERLGVGIAVMGFSVIANLAVSAVLCRQARAHESRPHWPVTRHICAPTRSPRSASLGGSAAGPDHRSGRLRLDHGADRGRRDRRRRGCGSSAAHPGVLVDEALPDVEMDRDRGGDRRRPHRGGRRLPQAACAARRRAPLRRPARPVPLRNQPRAGPRAGP